MLIEGSSAQRIAFLFCPKPARYSTIRICRNRHQHRTRTMVSKRLSVVALYICTTVDAFSTTSPIQQIVKVSSRFTVPPLGGSKTAIPDLSSSTKPIAETSIVDVDDASENYTTWQKNLDVLLAPDTSVAERQIVLSDLLSSRDAIQKSVRTALRERKVSFIVFILVSTCFYIVNYSCRLTTNIMLKY